MNNKTVATSIRITMEMKEKLEKLAAEDSRSFNNYVVLILSKWIKQHESKE